MTFVENAFKYGVSNHESTPIAIRLHMSANSLTFFCQNRILTGKPATERNGIGLLNTQQRLAHLYPGRHEQITQTG